MSILKRTSSFNQYNPRHIHKGSDVRCYGRRKRTNLDKHQSETKSAKINSKREKRQIK